MRFFSLLLFLSFPILNGCNGPVEVAAPGKLTSFASGLHKTTVDVPDVGSVKYAIEVPKDYDPSTPRPLVLLLHYGYEGAQPDPYTGSDMIYVFRNCLSDLGAIAIAPDVTGGDWTNANNEKAAVWLVESAMETYNIDKEQVMVTGYSMGGQGAWFIGSRHQDLFTAIVPIAAPVAGNPDQWKVPIFAVHSSNDQVVSFKSAKEHADSVQSSGAKIKFREIENISHYEMPKYVPFFKEAAEWVWSE